MPRESHRKISLVIPFYNEERNIEHCIESVIQQIRMPDEIVFVDNNSGDNSRTLAENYLGKFSVPVKIVSQQEQGISCARNKGVIVATGEIIVFLDGDCVAKPDYIQRIEKNFETNAVEAVTGKYVLLGKDSEKAKFREIAWAEHFGWGQGRRIIHSMLDQVGTLVSGCSAILRQTILDLGMYDERVRYMDDVEFSKKFYKAGCKALFDPEIIIEHCIETGEYYIFRKDMRYGSEMALINKYFEQQRVVVKINDYKKIFFLTLGFFTRNRRVYFYQARTLIYFKLGAFLRGISMGCLYI